DLPEAFSAGILPGTAHHQPVGQPGAVEQGGDGVPETVLHAIVRVQPQYPAAVRQTQGMVAGRREIVAPREVRGLDAGPRQKLPGRVPRAGVHHNPLHPSGGNAGDHARQVGGLVAHDAAYGQVQSALSAGAIRDPLHAYSLTTALTSSSAGSRSTECRSRGSTSPSRRRVWARCRRLGRMSWSRGCRPAAASRSPKASPYRFSPKAMMPSPLRAWGLRGRSLTASRNIRMASPCRPFSRAFSARLRRSAPASRSSKEAYSVRIGPWALIWLRMARAWGREGEAARAFSRNGANPSRRSRAREA